MAYISFQPKDYYNTVPYTSNGTAIGSGGLTVTGFGFTPTWLWLKVTNADESWGIYDSVSGVTKGMRFNGTEAIVTQTEGVTTFNSDGFICGNQSRINATNGTPQVGFGFAGGTTAVPSGGTITPSACNFSATAGWGIYAFNGNSTQDATIAHGLSSAPKFIMVKKTDDTGDWYTGSSGFTDWDAYIKWNGSANEGTSDTYWGGVTPSSSVITLGDASGINNSAKNYLLYAFCDVKGYQSIGKYKGNGNADGTFVYTGFRPALVITRRADSSGGESWKIFNDKEQGYNPDNDSLLPDTGNGYSTNNYLDIVGNGFKITSSNTGLNQDGINYFYMAVAKNSMVSSNDIPGVAR